MLQRIDVLPAQHSDSQISEEKCTLTLETDSSHNLMVSRITLIIILGLASFAARAQQYDKAGEIDFFIGMDFSCRDIYFNGRVFDMLVNLTPGVRWNMGRRWEAALQLYVPVINQFGDYYKHVRPSVATVAKQFAIGSRVKMKVSGGVFTADSYGLDLKGMVVVNRWLAVSAQAGLTGYLSMADKWKASPMTKFTFMAGPEFYLSKWNTQMSLRAGRYLFNDYGVEAEAFRHFRHVSVGVFGSYSSLSKDNAGFKVIVMLPPYKRTRRKVNFRLADDFRIKYSFESTGEGTRRYATDPEENEREGWFDRDLLPWGTDMMEADFKCVDKNKGNKNKVNKERKEDRK